MIYFFREASKMAKKIWISKYKKGEPYSYTLGPFPTMELLRKKPELAQRLVLHPDFQAGAEFEVAARDAGVPAVWDAVTLSRIAEKEICLAAAQFAVRDGELNAGAPHVVLVNLSDMGNVGTILRTLLGLGIRDCALIEPCADVFHPRCVRASMGALFSMNLRRYPDFDSYRAAFPDHALFPFMLDSSKDLLEVTPPGDRPFALVFGNESHGLPAEFAAMGQSVRIPQTEDVDSLNVAVAAAIGTFHFLHTGSR